MLNIKMVYCTVSLLIGVLIFTTPLFADTNQNTAVTSNYFNSIVNNPNELLLFLKNMPKGGDLHNHLAGATYAENLISYADTDNFCVDPRTHAAVISTSCKISNQIAALPSNKNLYNSTINAWSMRNFYPHTESGHDHFFATFGKFSPVEVKHSGQVLTEIVARAAKQHEEYLELMVTPDNDASGALGKQIGWNDDLGQLRTKLLANGLPKIVSDISKQMTIDEAYMKTQLHCNSANTDPACHVSVRYLYQVLREQQQPAVFAQLLAGFEVANNDPRFVGINLVQPEDGYISMRDYDQQMQMIGFLHQLYPKVNISLHAGELVSGLVPPQGLLSHIRKAVEIAHAERIGHGVDIAYETNFTQLLKEMAQKHILVEINLTSNAEILGVSGNKEPLMLYLKHNVPVALSTDDEGVLRINLTHEYQRAVTSYHLSYTTLKNIDRNSLTYSFIPGNSLWLDANKATPVAVCQQDVLGINNPSNECQAFLNQNEKARLQWKLEHDFVAFEDTISKQNQLR